MSSSPQNHAVDLIHGFIAREVGASDVLGVMREQAKRLAAELAEAGLLVPPQPNAWAVLRQDDDVIYDSEATASRVLSVLAEDGETNYRLYELREVTDAQ